MAGAGDWATDDFKTLLAGFGGDGHLVNDKFEAAFDSPEGVEALTYYVDLINKKKVTPPGTTSASWDNVATSFSDGLTAMTHELSRSEPQSECEGHGRLCDSADGQVDRARISGPGCCPSIPSRRTRNGPIARSSGSPARRRRPRRSPINLHPTRASVYENAAQGSGDQRRSSAISTTFLESRWRLASVGPRLTNYGDVDRAVWVAVNNAARGAATPEAALKAAAGAGARSSRSGRIQGAVIASPATNKGSGRKAASPFRTRRRWAGGCCRRRCSILSAMAVAPDDLSRLFQLPA